MNPKNHWDQLARLLGADIPNRDDIAVEESKEEKVEQSFQETPVSDKAEQESTEEPPRSDRQVPSESETPAHTGHQTASDSASAQRSASRSLRSVSTHHWESLAGSLGITVPESELEPEIVVEKRPARREPKPASELKVAENPNVEEPEEVRGGASSDANGEKRSHRSRRRRGGSERPPRQSSTAKMAPTASTEMPREFEKNEAESPAECEIDLSFLDEGADAIDQEMESAPETESEREPESGRDTESDAESRPSRRRPSRRRRRRRGGGDQEPTDRDDDSSKETPIEWDGPSPDEESDTTASESDGRSNKQPGRRFPTWGDAVGILVSTNMASRERSKPSEGRSSRGRRRRGGTRRS